MTWLYLPPSASPPSARASEGSTCPSESPSPEPALYCTSSGTPTARPSSWRGWRTRPWVTLLSGMRLAHSTAGRGAERWISSWRASPANPGPSPGNEPDRTTSGGSGRTSGDSFAMLDRGSWRSRMSQASLFGEDSLPSSTTWPSSGTMRGGACSVRPRSERPTSASGCSCSRGSPATDSESSDGSQMALWKTPKTPTGGAEARDGRRARGSGGEELEAQARLWPSPRAEDSESCGAHRGEPDGLTSATRAWMTPLARDWRSGETSDETAEKNSRPLSEAVCRCSLPAPETPTDGDESSPCDRTSPRPSRPRLNSLFVEWMLSWPQGWTDFAPVEMASWLSRARTRLRALLGGR